MTSTEAVHNRLTVTLHRIRDAITTVRTICPDWEHRNDARWAWFPGVKKVLMLTQLHLELRKVYLSDHSWWASRHPEFETMDIPDMLSECEVLYKWWTLHQPYAQLEEVLRRIAEALDPAFASPKIPISRISKYLCTELTLDKYITLFDLAHTTRNSIHNNGVFRPPDGKPKQISWKDRTYDLSPDDPLDFVSWEFVCEHIGDLTEAMCCIMCSPEISRLSDVKRL